MKHAISNTEDFLRKLNSLNFNAIDSKTLKSEEGYAISYSTKMSNLHGNKSGETKFIGLPIQLIFRIEKDGQYVASWGCMDLEDTTMLAKWFKLKENEIFEIEHRKENRVKNANEIVWDNM